MIPRARRRNVVIHCKRGYESGSRKNCAPGRGAYRCVRSDFEPTMTHGMAWLPVKFTILSCTIWTMSNELREATE